MLQKFEDIQQDKILKDVWLVKPSVYRQELEGQKASSIHTTYSTMLGIPVPPFIEDKVSSSKVRVLKGYHGDTFTWKMLTCLYGQVILSVADLRKNSRSYMKTGLYNLRATHPFSVIIPPGCVNAHLNVKDSVLHYKLSEHYRGPEHQVTVAYNDIDISPNWAGWVRYEDLLLTERDKNGISAKEVNW